MTTTNDTIARIFFSSGAAIGAVFFVGFLAPLNAASSPTAVGYSSDININAAKHHNSSATQRQRKASRRHTTRRPRGARKHSSQKVKVPIDMGLGPQALLLNPPIFFDQAVHTSLTLSIAAIIDKQLIHQQRRRIPAQYRSLARSVDEVSYRPWYLALIPELLIISPALFNTGMYGAVWRPLGFGLSLWHNTRAKLSIASNLDLAYLFIHSRTLPSPTHFLRPGINLEFVLRVAITYNFLLSTGWSSDFFLPQGLGQAPWELWPENAPLWHLGGPFLKLHWRIPIAVNL